MKLARKEAGEAGKVYANAAAAKKRTLLWKPSKSADLRAGHVFQVASN